MDVDTGAGGADDGNPGIQTLDREGLQLVVVHADADELVAHEERLQAIDEAAGGKAVWRRL